LYDPSSTSLRKFPVVSGQSSVYSPISISPALVVILAMVGMEPGAFTGTRAYGAALSLMVVS